MLNSIKSKIKRRNFSADFNMDTGELFCPKCGTRFADVVNGQFPLPTPFKVEVPCPICGTEVKYHYEFSAVFKCSENSPTIKSILSSLSTKENLKYQLRLLTMKLLGIPHYIAHHSDVERKDGDSSGEKVFLRKCICGKNILLKQRRVE